MSDTKDPGIKAEEKAVNRDPITKEPGSHPVGTGIGAAVTGMAGAAIGALAGPAGAIAGSVIGSALGGAAGHGIGEMVDPTVEVEYWRENYSKREYVTPGVPYNEYEPAYRFGWESAARYEGCSFEDVEPALRHGWSTFRGGDSRLEWEAARPATRDAWNRINKNLEART